MALDVVCKRDQDIMIITAAGEIDFHNFQILRSSVAQALSEGDLNFILDLSGITYLDSSALGSLLYNQKKIRERSGRLVIISSRALRDVLDLTHLDTYFKLVNSIADGYQWFSKIEETTSRPS